MGVKAVALLSGGLDSTLAVKLMLEQGIEVHALNFTSAFCSCNSGGKHHPGHPSKEGKPEAAGGGGCRSESKRVADEFGIPLKVLMKGLDYIEVVRNAKHGYGKGINPCLDCRIYMYKLAKKYMEEIGASFIITGEVLGQRPMSQRKDAMRIIEEESGLKGLIVRPLCAKQMEPTIPETAGLVDREKLLDVVGRSRKQQMELAEELDINDYPCPSGGCLLTDKIFSKKVRDLLNNKEEVTKKDLALLKTGRHFRYKGTKIVVGKNADDNIKIKNLVQPGDIFLEPVDFHGPVALVCGGSEEAKIFASSLIIRYALDKAGERPMIRATKDGEAAEFAAGTAASDNVIEELRVC